MVLSHVSRSSALETQTDLMLESDAGAGGFNNGPVVRYTCARVSQRPFRWFC